MNTQALDQLAHVLPVLPQGRAEFATDLINQGRRRGLSEKQWEWVGRLIDMASRPAPAPAPEQVGDMSGLIALFAAAGEKLKYPKIRLATPEGTPVVLQVAGARSRYAGSINLTDGGPYGANRWYGRVSPQGELVSGSAMTEGVKDLVRDMATAPAETAARYGKLTGHCCFCGKELTDTRSTEVGYGPICARNWGLPWGA